MTKLSNVDKKYFSDFRKKYPGWNIERLDDHSMRISRPEPTNNVPNNRRIFIDRD